MKVWGIIEDPSNGELNEVQLYSTLPKAKAYFKQYQNSLNMTTEAKQQLAKFRAEDGSIVLEWCDEGSEEYKIELRGIEVN